MNYYPHHIGDFNNATRHLSRNERAIYRELIELYYDSEKPLPADDFEWICKKVLAVSQDDRDSVKAILREFFVLDGDFYRHTRCDNEIEAYRARHQAALKGALASARVRSKATAQRSLSDRSTSAELTKNQEPITNNQKKKDVVGQKPDLKPLAVEILTFLNEKTGRNYQPVDANIRLIAARLRDGATVDECRAVIAKKCREWAGDEKMNEYLRPGTLFNAQKFAQYQGELVA